MVKTLRALAIALCLTTATTHAAEPDYSRWNELLGKYYDSARGMDYRGLKAKDAAALNRLRDELARVDVSALTRNEQLAFWMNLYNVSAVGIVVAHYPVESIRDISTDPIIRLNVFKRDLVSLRGTKISLDQIEHERIRQGFRDPRIHFAINCAAKSCPPMLEEAFRGARVDAQLDRLARDFVSRHVRIERDGDETIVRTTKIMEWFKDDFERWGGGSVAFLRQYLRPEQSRRLAGKVKLEYDDYDWRLNDWQRTGNRQ